ncbi:MAG TPA: efflux RND transporter periplasmic adaptor subunit, partial [Gammaproteobacteria bacterium]|nr:efflux RND transporter periplasmic adaptor subunit [Gammaproteobacteria bacterium]
MSETRFKKILNTLIVVTILLVAIALSFYLLSTQPQAERITPQVQVPLVETVIPSFGEHSVTVQAMGRVIAAQQVELMARVSGEVIKVSPLFVPGGMFKKNDWILKIDPTDYELTVQQRKSDLIRAEYELALEMGRQQIAKQDYVLLGEKLEGEELSLVLRQPHLEMAKANISAARSLLDRAQLDLRRTLVKAPFNALVQEKKVSIGSQVTTATPLMTLVDTDTYWVEAAIPMDQLKWIKVGGDAYIKHESAWEKSDFRRGTVQSIKPMVGQEDHMAQIIVAIKDPMALKTANKNQPKLMAGAFVRVEMMGRTLADVLHIPESSLHEGSFIWVMNKNDTLDIRSADIRWRESGVVYIANQLEAGERLIVSDLAAPV